MYLLIEEVDLALIQDVIDAVVEEASERNFEIDVDDLTYRLCDAYANGERDPEKLVAAALFNRTRKFH